MTFPTGQLPPDVIQALQEGRTIEAVKRLRKMKGLGLAEAKAAIDAYAKGPPASSPRLANASRSADQGRVLPDIVLEALQRGDKDGAIRLLRGRIGVGLNEATRRIEAAHVFAPASHVEVPRSQPPPSLNRSGLAPGEVRQSNAALWLVIGLIAVLMAYYLLT